jgi:hypothetical protein
MHHSLAVSVLKGFGYLNAHVSDPPPMLSAENRLVTSSLGGSDHVRGIQINHRSILNAPVTTGLCRPFQP